MYNAVIFIIIVLFTYVLWISGHPTMNRLHSFVRVSHVCTQAQKGDFVFACTS